jgi:DNA mismatch repair protein PMS2
VPVADAEQPLCAEDEEMPPLEDDGAVKEEAVPVVASSRALSASAADILQLFAQTHTTQAPAAVAPGSPTAADRASGSLGDESLGFRADEAAVAEEALSRRVGKDDFGLMSVLGQFNLGFMLTQLRGDLYIMDQHASDEKHTFETLRRTCVLHQQPLIKPQPLPLAVEHEETVHDHLDTFRKLGFDIVENPDYARSHAEVADDQDVAATTVPLAVPRFLLRSRPSFRTLTLSHIDIAQVCQQLLDNPYAQPLIQRLDTAHASRACRTSVMIGTPLTLPKMKSIISNMTGLDHPWACPHGRPTMRHLVSLKDLVPEVTRRLRAEDAFFGSDD